MAAPITFESPVRVRVSMGDGGLWRHIAGTRSASVLKTGTSYLTVDGPTAEQIDAADVVYLGAHTYIITETEAAALTAAGYGAGLGGAVDGYGAGPYGGGDYGIGQINQGFGDGPFGDGPFGD